MIEQTPLRVAIVGQGRSGRDIHGAYFLRDGGRRYQVVAIADELADRRARAQAELGCDVYADYHSLLERQDIDLVVNATYSYLHYPVTMEFLERGFRVLTEKPFAIHAADCDAMIAKAAQRRTLLAVFQQSRLMPYYCKLKEVLASGVLGEIVQMSLNWSGYGRRWDWQCSQRFGGGTLYNTCPHPVDQALDLLGWDTEPQVFSRLGCYLTSGDAEDYVKILLTAPGKPLIDIEATSTNDSDKWLYRVQGTRGTLRADMNHVEWHYFVPEDEPVRPLVLSPLSHEDGTPAYCGEKLTWHEASYDVPGNGFELGVDAYYDMLYRHIVLGEPRTVLPEQSRKQIAIMERIHAENPLPVKF